MHAMSREEWWTFASEGTRTGKLAVVRADGSPHVTPIWFVLNETADGDELIFNTGVNSAKGKALRREPRISLTVDDQAPPFSFVQFTAVASLHEDLDEMLRWATAIGARYMGEDRGEEFGKRNAMPGEYLVRAKITKVLAYGDLTG
ncbi:PPOX class F420-dependent oxidoreductase [Amycolatopsis pithecellobii]|uniref:TIGR03618 family F420-dependent PPOX class oxidoreductase n=1 Tax=Amycolatopsis pithecellobii TaxID=664692 RepID=A0A6N7YVC1_9PSEU|nr:PPOX class F420-dependent oxidoreductase [Amycolatopsis pithecellobii]MTD55892.1 TIGR03618 family F420-dependent PPOX class oxidoreductase [Amycolatopsis pithecellobii]